MRHGNRWPMAMALMMGLAVDSVQAAEPPSPQPPPPPETAKAAGVVKKVKKHHKRKKAAAQAKEAATAPVGPFSDVPQGHWAREAIQKAVDSGLLQGYDGKFLGGRPLTRYQAAVLVTRMLDRLHVLKSSGRIFTAQDIANLESLTIEFADELALLNVKVGSLEDKVAALNKDVDAIKADLKANGIKAGLSGTMSARYVSTGNGGPGYLRNTDFTTTAATRNNLRGAGGGAGAGNPFDGADVSSATEPITRYHGGPTSGVVPNGTNTGVTVSGRDFLTASNFSLSVDREYDRHTRVHAQMNVNAEGANDPASTLALGTVADQLAPTGATGAAGFLNTPAGRGSSFTVSDIMVNEAYAYFEDWFSDVDGRAGVWAVPMNTEVNGVGRTYDWTITPTITNTHWEQIRPVGVDIFQDTKKQEVWWYAGFFTSGDSRNGVNRAGTLLAEPTGYSPGAPVGSSEFSGSAAFGNAGGGVVFRRSFGAITGASPGGGGGSFGTNNRFMNSAMSVMSDAPAGITAGQGLNNDNIGWYALFGTHPRGEYKEGFRWHAAYFDNGGNLRPGSGFPTATEWTAWQLAGTYKWEHWNLMGQYYDGSSKNNSPVDIMADSRRAFTPFVNASEENTDSWAWTWLLNYAWDKRGSATVRYETARDKTGLAELRADVWTLGLNYRPSHCGWLQLEWIAPTTSSVAEDGSGNSVSIADQLWQLNYKLAF